MKYILLKIPDIHSGCATLCVLSDGVESMSLHGLSAVVEINKEEFKIRCSRPEYQKKKPRPQAQKKDRSAMLRSFFAYSAIGAT